jgi:hypothetical protein
MWKPYFNRKLYSWAHLMERGLQSGCSPQSKILKKNTDFVDKLTSKVLRDLRFGLNRPLK